MYKRKRSKKNSSGSRERIQCGHCRKVLSKRQYHEHKRQFYNAVTKQWTVMEDLITLSVVGSSSSDGGCITILIVQL